MAGSATRMRPPATRTGKYRIRRIRVSRRASAFLPGTSGFVGEFMVVLAAFQYDKLVAFGAATTLILGAACTLWMVKRVVFGKVANHHVAELTDINAREAWVLGIFALGVLAVGLYPKPLTDLMDASIAQLVVQLSTSKL